MIAIMCFIDNLGITSQLSLPKDYLMCLLGDLNGIVAEVLLKRLKLCRHSSGA